MFDKLNISEMMKKAQEMQKQMEQVQKEAEKIEATGTSGADLVQVVINGKFEIIKIDIDDSLIKDDKKMLEDLIVAAFNDAIYQIKNKLKEKQSSVFGSQMAGMNLPFNL